MTKSKPLISRDRMLMLVANGMSDVKIAAACQVSRKSVERYRNMYGIPPGTPDGRQGVARVANQASREARERLVPRGKGGDAEFGRLMQASGSRFQDRAERTARQAPPPGRLMS